MEEDLKIVDEKDLEKIAGGDIQGFTDGRGGDYRTVMGTRNYLALRNEPNYDERNEIGKLYNGDQVQIVGGRYQGPDGRIYVVVYAPRLGAQGFVNENYVR